MAEDCPASPVHLPGQATMRYSIRHAGEGCCTAGRHGCSHQDLLMEMAALQDHRCGRLQQALRHAEPSRHTLQRQPPMVARSSKCAPGVEPVRGLEPLTFRLQVECATNCATPASPTTVPEAARGGRGTGRAATAGDRDAGAVLTAAAAAAHRRRTRGGAAGPAGRASQVAGASGGASNAWPSWMSESHLWQVLSRCEVNKSIGNSENFHRLQMLWSGPRNIRVLRVLRVERSANLARESRTGR